MVVVIVMLAAARLVLVMLTMIDDAADNVGETCYGDSDGNGDDGASAADDEMRLRDAVSLSIARWCGLLALEVAPQYPPEANPKGLPRLRPVCVGKQSGAEAINKSPVPCNTGLRRKPLDAAANWLPSLPCVWPTRPWHCIPVLILRRATKQQIY